MIPNYSINELKRQRKSKHIYVFERSDFKAGITCGDAFSDSRRNGSGGGDRDLLHSSWASVFEDSRKARS